MARAGTIAILSCAAAALALLWVFGGGDSDAPGGERERVFPGFDRADIALISLSRDGEEIVRLQRDAGGSFVLAETGAESDERAAADVAGGVRADPEVVARALDAFELLTYQRRGGAAEGLASPRAGARAEAEDGRVWAVEIGDAVELSRQVWMRAGRGGEPFTAEAHAARALAPDPAELADPRPFRAGELSALAFETGGEAVRIELENEPRVEVAGGGARADRGAVDGLVRDVRGLEIRRGEGVDRTGARPPEGSPELGIRAERAGGGAIAWRTVGVCEGGDPAVETSAGAGCADAGAVAALAEKVRDPRDLVAPPAIEAARAIGAGAGGRIRVRVADGSALALRSEGGGAFSVEGDAGARRVSTGELAGVLRALAEGAGAPAPRPEATERGLIELEIEGRPREVVSLVESGDRLFAAREGEPVAFPVPRGPWARLEPGETALASLRLISREAREVVSIARDRPAFGPQSEEIARGELLGEYEVARPEGADLREDSFDRARATIASLRAERFADPAPSARRGLDPPRVRAEVVFEAPPLEGAERERRLVDVGADAGEGCYARVDGGPVAVLAGETCRALAAPWIE